jgi:hypothetical protein
VHNSLDTYDKLLADKATMLTLWREIGEFLYPNQSDFGRYYTTQSNQPNKRRLIFDPTGEQALDIFASSMVGLLANPAAKWLAFETDNQSLLDDKEVQIFLDDAQRKTLSVFNNPRTKFYDNLQTCLKMIGAFGAGMLLVDTDEDSVVKFRAESPRNFDYTEDFGGNVKDVFLERVYTVAALKDKKDEWQLPVGLLDRPETDKMTVIRHIQPNPNFDPTKLGKKFAKFHSHYYLKDTKTLLHTGFFNSVRAAVGRWDRVDGSKWPDSCARVALANVKLMQNADRSMIVAMEKELRPTLFVSSEAKFGKLDTSAGAVNVGRGNPNDSIREMRTTGNVGQAFAWMEVKRQQIRQAFYVDVFQTAESLAMTATEANIRNQEKLRIVTPKAAKIQSDLLGVVAETVLAELIKLKQIKVPRALLEAGGEIKVTYISPIAQAQRFGDAQNMLQFMNDISMIAQAFPEALDKVDPDAMVDEMAEIRGIPESILRGKKTTGDKAGFEDIRAQRAQAQQMQQQIAMAQQAGEAGQAVQGVLNG